MKIVKTIQEVQEIVKEWKEAGAQIGLVPTMGYLHAGHGSLIEKSVSENDKTVVSVFVNPTQFGENEDLESYPRDMDRDSAFCEKLGADLIFNPEPETMYPQPFFSHVFVDTLSEGLCGRTRPVHFAGVCLVLTKLFHIVGADRAYFGQKDAQQLLIVKRMVKDLNFPITIIGCPIVREEDGLAMSSRNIYLTDEERNNALVLSRSLRLAKEKINAGEADAGTIKKIISDEINTVSHGGIDYVEIVDTERLDPVDTITGETLIALAVRFGKARLIDNIIIKKPNQRPS